jgi:hypothetical protein
MTDTSTQRLASGRAWDDFCENLRLTGKMIDSFGDSITALDRAEWYRCLTRYARGGLERYLEAGEPMRPQFRDLAWRHTINFTSPMQDHLFVEFRDGATAYRIDGNRGTVPYFVMASWRSAEPDDPGARDWASLGVAGLKEFDPAMLNTIYFLESKDIDFDANGDFSVVVSRERPADGANWLQIPPDCRGLLIRSVFVEREGVVPPVMTISRLDGAAPQPITEDHVSWGLAKTAQATLGYAELIRSWWQDNIGKRPNTILFSRAVYLSNGGVDDDRHHGFGSWECGLDEALVIRFTPTPCDFWTFQLCNIWQENFDNYQEGQGYLHKGGAKLEADGSLLAVLARSDPGIGGNWLDPYGHTIGGWSFRLVKTRGEPPEIVVHRVKLDQLRAQGLAALDGAGKIVSGQLTD